MFFNDYSQMQTFFAELPICSHLSSFVALAVSLLIYKLLSLSLSLSPFQSLTGYRLLAI